MKRLSDELKRVLNAMALQDVVDFLPLRDMLAMPAPGERRLDKFSSHRVAMLSDGHTSREVLQYALEACLRQHAGFDLVLYGEARLQAEESRSLLQRKGIAHEVILLGQQTVDALREYLMARHALIYLVAPANDIIAGQLAEENPLRRNSRSELPVVLIDDSSHSRINSINAA